MKKIYLISFIFLFYLNPSRAQSIFQESHRTSFSSSFSSLIDNDSQGAALSAAITLNAKSNFIVSYSTIRINTNDFDTNKLTGRSLDFYTGFMVLNELNKIDKFGFEFGLIQQTIWYEFGIPTTNLFGVNLGLSKRVNDEESYKLKHVFKLGLNAFPIVLIQDKNDYSGINKHIVGESFAVFNPSIAFVFDMSKASKLVIEPMISFNTENTPVMFSITAHLVL